MSIVEKELRTMILLGDREVLMRTMKHQQICYVEFVSSGSPRISDNLALDLYCRLQRKGLDLAELAPQLVFLCSALQETRAISNDEEQNPPARSSIVQPSSQFDSCGICVSGKDLSNYNDVSHTNAPSL